MPDPTFEPLRFLSVAGAAVVLLSLGACTAAASFIEQLPIPEEYLPPPVERDPGPERGFEGGEAWRWSTAQAIPVCWANSVSGGDRRFDDETRKKRLTRQVVENEWARYSALSFSGWGDCGPGSETGIQIQIMWEDRGDLNPNGQTNPSSSVGRQSILNAQRGAYEGGARPGMHMQFDAPDYYVRSSALHEFGHALGFYHEHRRTDSQGNFLSDATCQSLHPPRVGDEAREGAVFLSEVYDKNSVMNYCPVFGQFFDAISEGDAIGVQAHYGVGPGGPILKAATLEISADCPRKYPSGGGLGAAFLHVWNNTCWSCPEGFDRTANPDVASRNACRRPGQTLNRRATYRGNATGILRTDCPSGQFLHGLSGRCYSCPSGYGRTLAGIDAPNACSKTEDAQLRAGTERGRPGCPEGSFEHGLTARCYSCGDGYDRSAVIADRLEAEPRACVRRDWGIVRMTTLPWRTP